MERFVGRKKELHFLEQYYGKDGCQLVVVYGSRGVGKTRLLSEFCRGKKAFYYLARACSDREQRCQWAGELAERGVEAAGNGGGAASGGQLTGHPEYGELFRASLLEKETTKQVLVIDEFHHVVKAGSDFFESLVNFLDGRLMSRPVMAVLCTSASGWVENHLVSRLNGLASAIGGFLKLRELKFADIREQYPGYSTEDCIRGYAVLGGMPGYWTGFSQTLDVRENVVRNLLAKESRLSVEMESFLEQELREPGVYNTILAAMAGDCSKLDDVYRRTGFSRAKISVYLKNLMELDLVEKVYSFDTDGRDNARKGIYRIASPCVRFYFRYLFPNQSRFQLMSPGEFYERYVEPSFDLFAEEAYRAACREHVCRDYRTAGEWLGKTGILDVVASDGQGKVGVAACSFSRKMEYRDYEWLLFSMKKARLNSSDVRLYCEKGFDDALRRKAEEGGLKLCRIGDDEEGC